jgi:hypothetical protein
MLAKCGASGTVEHRGLLTSWSWASGQYGFLALVPTGASVSLTSDGATSAVPVSDAIASGVVTSATTVTIQIANSTVTHQIGPGETDVTPPAGTSSSRR